MRLLHCLCAFLCLFFLFSQPVQADISLSAENAILIDQQTGDVLFEQNAHHKQSIASITKIMTAIIAIESGQMDEMAKVSRNAIHTEGSSIYLEESEKMNLTDLVYGLMLRSGNDAAIAIAEHIGGSEEGFVFLMNEKARWLGMTNTNFENPHGLEDEHHYSTAYDMALLMQYAMNDPQFQKISNTTSYTATTRSYGWKNKNKLLTHLYEYCTGGKTGYTKKAGRTLVSTAENNGHQLIAVTLNAPDDWNDHIQLFSYGFDRQTTHSHEAKTEPIYGKGNQTIRPFHMFVSNVFKQIMRIDTDG